MDPAEIAYQEAHIDETRAPTLIGIFVMLLAISFVVVALRLYTRRLTRVGLGWDDYWAIASLFFSAAIVAEIITMCSYGFGKHAVALTITEGTALSKTLFAFEITWPFLNYGVRASLLFLYLRIFEWHVGYFRIAWWIVFVWIGALFFGFEIAGLTQCNPISLFWDASIQDPCRTNFTPSLVLSTLNSISDLALMLLPLPAVWALQMGTKHKIATVGVFILGSLVLIVSIVRIPYMQSGTTSIDSTYTIIPALILTYLEPTVGLLCGCLIVLRPLWNRLRGRSPLADSKPNSGAYNLSTGRTMGSQAARLDSKTEHDRWSIQDGRWDYGETGPRAV